MEVILIDAVRLAFGFMVVAATAQIVLGLTFCVLRWRMR